MSNSGPPVRVLHLVSFTKMQKFHFVLLLLSILTHSFSHPLWELSAWFWELKGEWEGSCFGFQGIHSWGWDTDVSGDHSKGLVEKCRDGELSLHLLVASNYYQHSTQGVVDLLQRSYTSALHHT